MAIVLCLQQMHYFYIMKRVLLNSMCFVFLLAIVQPAFAQDDEPEESWRLYNPESMELSVQDSDGMASGDPVALHHGPFSTAGTGKVVVHNDFWIDTLANSFQKKQLRPGYRIQIYRGQKSDEARGVKTGFAYRHDEQPVYYDYDKVNFLVSVGNFRSRLEAMRYLKEIKGEFPAAYIVISDIEPVSLPTTFGSEEDIPEE